MTNPTPLSPAARAVLDAYRSFWLDEPMHTDEECLAAALCAAADQVVPNEPHPGESQFWDDEANREWQNNQSIRKQILAIAAELKGAQ